MSRVLVIEVTAFGARAALLEAGRLTDVTLADADDCAIRERVFLGRVRAVAPALDAAFIDCGLGEDAMLAARHARFVPGPGRRAPIGRRLAEGQAVIVQGLRAPAGDKAARVTADVALSGLFVVLRPRRSDVGVSARLARTDEARAQRARALRLFPEGGVVLRSAAVGTSDEELLGEAGRLRARWQRIEAEAGRARPPAPLEPARDPLEAILVAELTPSIARVIVTERTAFARARRFLEASCPAMAGRLDVDPDAAAAFGVQEQIEEALASRVPLDGGGSLIIEPTAALTAIDVDGAGRRALDVDLAAAREVARQLRLRRIGGTVVVDFVDLPAKRERERVVATLRQALASDPVPVQVWPMTALGLVQISRRRDGPSLAETLGRACPLCAGTGVVPGLRHQTEALMRAVASVGPSRVRARLAPDLHDYVSGPGAPAWRAFAARHPWGRIEPDRSLAPGAFRLEPEGTP